MNRNLLPAPGKSVHNAKGGSTSLRTEVLSSGKATTVTIHTFLTIQSCCLILAQDKRHPHRQADAEEHHSYKVAKRSIDRLKSAAIRGVLRMCLPQLLGSPSWVSRHLGSPCLYSCRLVVFQRWA